MIVHRRTRLADGREAVFFQDSEEPRAPIDIDQRPVEPRPDSGHLRFDLLTGEWVAVATHRQSRTHLPAAAECPLCPSQPGRPTEVPAADYDVVVFENRFPSLGPGLGEVIPDPGQVLAEAAPALGAEPGFGQAAETSAPARTVEAGLSAPGSGRCEVVVFSSDHNGSFAGLDTTRVRTVIEAWAHRTAELSVLPGIAEIFVFENRGEEIGVTMNHPHGQIYAYPYTTPHTARTSVRANRYQQETGRALMGDILAFERGSGERIVIESEHFSAFVPFAARWPIEVHLVPHRQVLNLADLDAAERNDLARIYPEILRRIDALYATPTPYIAAWHQAPVNSENPDAQWLRLEITSPRRAENKLKFLAGSESAMGAFVSDVSAEETARRLRSAGAADWKSKPREEPAEAPAAGTVPDRTGAGR